MTTVLEMPPAPTAKAVIALVGAVLTVVFLPKVNTPVTETMKPGRHDERELVGPQPAPIGHAA